MNYKEYKELKKEQTNKVAQIELNLKGFESYPNGLVKEEVRATKEYKQTNTMFQNEFNTLQEINKIGTKLFKKEMNKERLELKRKRYNN
jgi:hypothetical protein